MDITPIEIIFVKPKNRRYCEYIVNDSSTHQKTYEELSEYLCNLVPELKREISNFIQEKKTFFLFPKENQIEELKYDLEKELQELKLEKQCSNIQKILPNYTKIQKKIFSNKFQRLDSIVQKISKMS